jgi:hypothetical protein
MSMTAEAPEVWEVIQHQQNNPHLYRQDSHKSYSKDHSNFLRFLQDIC